MAEREPVWLGDESAVRALEILLRRAEAERDELARKLKLVARVAGDAVFDATSEYDIPSVAEVAAFVEAAVSARLGSVEAQERETHG